MKMKLLRPQNRMTIVMVSVIVLLLAAAIASQVRFVSTREWKHEDYQGSPFFSLSRFLRQAVPNTPQLSLRRWPEFRSSAAATATGQLLFVNNTDNAGQADYQALLKWVAAGNHVVLPLPYHATDKAFPRAGKNDSPFRTRPRKPEPSVQYAPWLRQTLAVDVQEVEYDDIKKIPPQKANAFVQSACQQALARIQTAQQQTKDENGQSSALGEVEANEFRLDCVHYLDDVRLPENTHVAWFDRDNTVLKPLPKAKVLWQGQGLVGSHIVRLAYGKGSVVLLSSIAPLENPDDPSSGYQNDLNRFEHAYLANYLAQDKTRLIFVDDITSPLVHQQNSSFAWWQLWQRFPLLMTLLLISILLLVWRFGLRLGAVHTPSTEETLDLTTYLHAQGQFLAHHGTPAARLDNMQYRLFQQWQQRWPNWPQLNHTAKLALLRDYYPNAEAGDLALWLNAIPHTVSDDDWLHYVQAHQRMTNFSGNRQI